MYHRLIRRRIHSSLILCRRKNGLLFHVFWGVFGPSGKISFITFVWSVFFVVVVVLIILMYFQVVIILSTQIPFFIIFLELGAILEF